MLFQLQRGLSTLPRLVRPAISSKRLISTTRPNLRNRGEGFLYNTFFKYSSRYIVFIFVGAAFGELFYNGFWEMVWNTNNKGKLYKDIDWTKWNSLYIEDEDEDEEE